MGAIKRLNQRYEAFSEITDVLPQDAPFTFSAKDNLCAKGFQARAGSKILDGYRPPFDATPVRRLREAGGVLIGKTNMDEFGFGTFSTHSGFGVPKNPFDIERACGGSSGGAACAAALIPGHVALGVSTGGSISCPASFCGVVGLTPTYGRVSRYGLIDYGNSLDKVGLISRTIIDIERLLPVISGRDPKDPTSCCAPSLDLSKVRKGPLAVPKECLIGLDRTVKEAFDRSVLGLRDMGYEVEEVDMPSLRFSMPAYYVLATAEASTNLARYCGMRFGVSEKEYHQHFNDYFATTRSKSFGDEAKRRILLGTFCRMVGFRDKYYLKALSVRQAVMKEYEMIFEGHSLVLSPTMPFIAPRFDMIAKMRPVEMYSADFLTIPPNLTGLPHLSIPCGYASGLPIGMQAVAPHWEEGALIHFGKRWESWFDYAAPEVKA
ncbi:MAG: Asp-tRNA(Asn)/Glu-tRNA(Gln) amidotransferase subunit GatA [Methanomassiliicoccales archaeon]|nr:MAG: Asp-tRNA(Asn)/Glu-tRNA(Gln) amidotransferase subunit GatA [Methanomassiliicoccales archaeon]